MLNLSVLIKIYGILNNKKQSKNKQNIIWQKTYMYLSHNSPHAHNPPFIRPGQSHKIYARSAEIWSQIQILIKFKAGRER